MEQKRSLELFRLRSSGAAIADGYRLYVSNFRNIFRATWLVAVVYAVVLTITAWYASTHVMPVWLTNTFTNGTASLSTPVTIGWCSLLVLSVVAIATLAAQGFAMLKEHSETGTIARAPRWFGRFHLPMTARMLMLTVWLLLITALCCLAGYLVKRGLAMLTPSIHTGSTTDLYVFWAVMIVVAFLLGLLLLPISYTMYRHLFAQKFSARPPLKGYQEGLCHLGRLFVVALVVAIVTLLLSLIIQLPQIILVMANVKAMMGEAYGDAVVLPQSISWVSLAVFAVGCFLQAWLHLSTLFPFYYVYGSIETERKESQSIKFKH